MRRSRTFLNVGFEPTLTVAPTQEPEANCTQAEYTPSSGLSSSTARFAVGNPSPFPRPLPGMTVPGERVWKGLATDCSVSALGTDEGWNVGAVLDLSSRPLHCDVLARLSCALAAAAQPQR